MGAQCKDSPKDEALPILAYLAYVEDTAVANEAVAVVTVHYAQMLWIRHVVDGAHRFGVPLRTLGHVATLDRFQGLQAQIVLVSLVSKRPG